MMQALTDCFVLSNGVKIPCVGFGTWQSPEGDVAANAVRTALETGYRHIDTAAVYGNERSVGRGIRESGIRREEIFVTSKLWNSEHGYETTLRAFDRTLEDLQLDYLDLYLIHWPCPAAFRHEWRERSLATWRAMEKLYRDGKIRAIGLSNFLEPYLQHILDNCEVPPTVDQIELHPGCNQEGTRALCRRHDLLVEAWSPLGTGKVLELEPLKRIAAKYDRSVAQVCIRWILQKGILPLPKSVTPSRIAENARVFDFALSEEDCAQIDALPFNGGNGTRPEEMTF